MDILTFPGAGNRGHVASESTSTVLHGRKGESRTDHTFHIHLCVRKHLADLGSLLSLPVGISSRGSYYCSVYVGVNINLVGICLLSAFHQVPARSGGRLSAQTQGFAKINIGLVFIH